MLGDAPRHAEQVDVEPSGVEVDESGVSMLVLHNDEGDATS